MTTYTILDRATGLVLARGLIVQRMVHRMIDGDELRAVRFSLELRWHSGSSQFSTLAEAVNHAYAKMQSRAATKITVRRGSWRLWERGESRHKETGFTAPGEWERDAWDNIAQQVIAAKKGAGDPVAMTDKQYNAMMVAGH